MGVVGWIEAVISIATCLLSLFAASWARSAYREGRELRRLIAAGALDRSAEATVGAPTVERSPLAASILESIGETTWLTTPPPAEEEPPISGDIDRRPEIPFLLDVELLDRIDALAEETGRTREELIYGMTAFTLGEAKRDLFFKIKLREDFLKEQQGEEGEDSDIRMRAALFVDDGKDKKGDE